MWVAVSKLGSLDSVVGAILGSWRVPAACRAWQAASRQGHVLSLSPSLMSSAAGARGQPGFSGRNLGVEEGLEVHGPLCMPRGSTLLCWTESPWVRQCLPPGTGPLLFPKAPPQATQAESVRLGTSWCTLDDWCSHPDPSRGAVFCKRGLTAEPDETFTPLSAHPAGSGLVTFRESLC